MQCEFQPFEREGNSPPLFPGPFTGVFRYAGGALEFDLPKDKPVYISSGGHTTFSRPPNSCLFPLIPNKSHTLSGNVNVEGGEVLLWLIEYSDTQRLAHQVLTLRNGPLRVTWRTHAECRSWCIALRFAGLGRLRLSSLRIESESGRLSDQQHVHPAAETTSVQTGVEGQFRACSIFADPCGYRGFVDKHHHFYDNWERSWYASAVSALQGAGSVLDIGCGPGALLQVLREAGVPTLWGLERDDVYLQQCHGRGLNVIKHDLNRPFPFIRSESFDAVVLHHSFDYLAPTAMRTILRESHRVLHPGGLLYIASRSDGQGSGDVTRTIRLPADLMRRLLAEAGFPDVKIESVPRNFRLVARRPAESDRWTAHLPRLATGHVVRPWRTPESVLPDDPTCWDAAGSRDFTLLTDAGKSEYRIDGKLAAFYTGYHMQGDALQRSLCRAESLDGQRWQRRPDQPVLVAGPPGSWDEGGLAAGSVIRGEGGPAPFILYFSARDKDGKWPGIGIALSHDTLSWTRQPDPVLTVHQYPGLRHLALADVIRTSSGKWLMHCEGWMEAAGWAIFQAFSSDGLHWEPTCVEPVLDPRHIPWGPAHAANPKCLEVAPGNFVLGFNAADATLAFHLGMAESTDARNWRLLDVNPVICAARQSARVESFFSTRDAWERGDLRAYYFRASELREPGSQAVVAEMDQDAAWPGLEWQTTRRGLYRIRNNCLVAASGTAREDDSLSRTVNLDRETQCTCRFSPESPTDGAVTITLWNDQHRYDLSIRGNGRVLENDQPRIEAADPAGAVSMCLRVLRPWSDRLELRLDIWHDDKPVLEEVRSMEFKPRFLRVAVGVPTGQPDLTIDHLDVWQPPTLLLEGYGDAHQYMGTARTGDPLLPDVGPDRMIESLDRHEIGRALVMSYGSGRLLDTFDQVCEAAKAAQGRVYPLYRHRTLDALPGSGYQFEIRQMELLWQEGLLFGLKTHMGTDEMPPEEVLAWIERRQLLTLWHVCSNQHLQWLEDNVLRRHTFPVLLSHFAGYPLDLRRYEAAIQMLSRYPQLYLVTSGVWFAAYLAQAIQQYPHQVLFGSDSPAIDPTAARAPILQLDVPEDHKALVLGENLRFLTERVQWHRWSALHRADSLLFPRLPHDEDDLRRQGFKVVPPGEMPPDEMEVAKDFWRTQDAKNWYEQHQPWRAMMADLVRDLKPESILEFGCNVGQNLVAIRQAMPDVRLLGIDVNPDAVRLGREKTGLDLVHKDESGLKDFKDGEFDLVFTVSVLDHIADVAETCRELVRIARRYVCLLEVRLPVEGKVVEHFDHHHNSVRPSTGASYSWHLEKYLADIPRIWRLDRRPCYLHPASLGPYYCIHLAFLDAEIRRIRP